MQVVTFDRVQQKVVLLKQLLKILRNGDEYARDRHGVAKATLIRQHKYGHLDEVAAQAKLDKWIYLQKLDRIHRLQITIYDQPSDTVNSNGQPQSNYTLDQVRQMILYCFGVNTKDVNFFNISNLQVAERVCVYLLEDARQTQRFEMELESQFDHVLDYAPQEHWLFNLLRIKVSNRQNNILSKCFFLFYTFYSHIKSESN